MRYRVRGPGFAGGSIAHGRPAAGPGARMPDQPTEEGGWVLGLGVWFVDGGKVGVGHVPGRLMSNHLPCLFKGEASISIT